MHERWHLCRSQWGTLLSPQHSGCISTKVPSQTKNCSKMLLQAVFWSAGDGGDGKNEQTDGKNNGEREKKCETPEIKAGKKGQMVKMNLKEGALKDKRSSFSTMELLSCEEIFLKMQWNQSNVTTVFYLWPRFGDVSVVDASLSESVSSSEASNPPVPRFTPLANNVHWLNPNEPSHFLRHAKGRLSRFGSAWHYGVFIHTCCLQWKAEAASK